MAVSEAFVTIDGEVIPFRKLEGVEVEVKVLTQCGWPGQVTRVRFTMDQTDESQARANTWIANGPQCVSVCRGLSELVLCGGICSEVHSAGGDGEGSWFTIDFYGEGVWTR